MLRILQMFGILVLYSGAIGSHIGCIPKLIAFLKYIHGMYRL